MSCLAHLRHRCRIQSTVTFAFSLTGRVGVCCCAVSLSEFHVFLTAGVSWYLSHTRLTWYCWAVIKWLCKPAYTKTLNSMNLNSLSRFSMVQDCGWMLYVTHGFSDKIIFQPAPSIFDVLCWWRTEEMNIHECAESPICIIVISTRVIKLCKLHPHISIRPHGPSFSLINDAEKMFFLPRKISSFMTETLQILMGSDNSGLVLTWWPEEKYIFPIRRAHLFMWLS